MKQDEQRNAEMKRVVSRIQENIKTVFSNYQRDVDRKNDEENGGRPNKQEKSEKIYNELSIIANNLNLILDELQDCEKLRKQRKDLFEKKTRNFIVAINQLILKKNIKIKISAHIEKLAIKSKDITTEVLKIIKLYKKESSTFCGKSYDYKPNVESSFLELAELSFLWENISSFESITNDSIKQIFLPIEYRPSDFQKLEQQVMKIWPDSNPALLQPPPPPPPPPPQVQKVSSQNEPIIIKSDLQKAHQHLFGFTRPQETAIAIEIYEKEITKPNPDPSALNALGTLHEQGKGFQKDLNKAFKYFMRAAEKGDPQGLYKVGQYLQKGLINAKQYFEGLYANRDAEVRGGIQYYEKAAAKGHLNALTDLGFIYQKGVMHENGSEFFIEPHPQHARKYYEKAKEKNYPRAYNNLGNLLICQNSGISNLSQNANLQKGIKYLIKAKQLGCAKGSLNLGKCYLTGTGVPVNLEKARTLFKEAADLGQIQGRLQYLRSYIGTQLEEQQTMNQLIETVRTVLLENKSNAEALYLMGLLEEKGIGVVCNKESTFHYIASSARLEYPPALTRLGDYYYSGYFVDKNYENARILYEKAGQRGDSQALLNLALMQEKGLLPMGSTLGDVDQLYKRAEQLGNSNAVLIRGLKKQGSLVKNEQVLKAAGMGNTGALRILTHNEANYMSSISNKEQLKKISTFYMKETLPFKRSFNSII